MAKQIPKTTTQWTVVGQNGLQDLQYQEAVPIPPLGDHDCLIKIEAVALNFRDVAIIKNQYPLSVNLPFIPTSDGAGTVVATGPRVRNFKPGDKVSPVISPYHIAGRLDSKKLGATLGGGTDGPLRQYAIYEDTALVEIPRNLSVFEACALPSAGVSAWNTLYGSENASSAVTRIKPGDIVLTQGTGGVSLFAIQLAIAAGATVIATTSTSEGKKVELLKSLGVKHVINYNADKNWGETAKSLTPNGVGVDHVVDVGGAGTLEQSLKAVRFEGTVSVVGFLADDANSGLGPGLMSTLSRAITVRGILGGSKLQFEELIRAIARLDIKPVIDERIFEFSQVREAYQYLMERRHVGKVVIKVK